MNLFRTILCESILRFTPLIFDSICIPKALAYISFVLGNDQNSQFRAKKVGRIIISDREWECTIVTSSKLTYL